MAHGTRISGTDKAVTAGLTRTGGVNKKITKGLTLVGGVQKDIVFAAGEPLRNLAVGTSVYTPVDGVTKEFIVVHQGKPSSIYDDSCDGTWLLMKELYTIDQWSTSNNSYKASAIHSYLNGDFLNLFDAGIKAQIKTVKIPYVNGTGSGGSVASGSSGLSAQIFLLSGYEVGWTTSTSSYFLKDGACLSYFSGAAATDPVRIGYFNAPKEWWLRSPSTVNIYMVHCVDRSGGNTAYRFHYSEGVRPAFVLPQSAAVDENFQIIAE